MKNAGKNATAPPDPARALRAELARKIAFSIGSRERLITDVPGLLLSRRTAPAAPAPATYQPSLAVGARGGNGADLGGRPLIFVGCGYRLRAPVLQVICHVIAAVEQ